MDLCGPSIPRMFRVQDNDVHQCDSGWVPVFVGQDKSISLMSIGFLLEKPDDAVVWRGPKKNGTVGFCCLWPPSSARNLLQTLLEVVFVPAGGQAFLGRSFLGARQGSCSAGVGSDLSGGESAVRVVLTDSPAVSPWVLVTQGASRRLPHLAHSSQGTC